MIRARVDGPHLYIAAPFEEKDLCKSLPGRRWHPQTKEWRIPATIESVRAFVQAFSGKIIEPGDGFEDLYQRVLATAARPPQREVSDAEIEGVRTAPWRHQRQAFWFLRDAQSALLDMGMGTGKSKVVVDLVSDAARISNQRVLILCPLSVVPVWPRQFLLHGWRETEVHVVALNDSMSVAKKRACCEVEQVKGGEAPVLVFVCNYESARLKPLNEWLLAQTWDFCILDESHKIKSPGSKISMFCARLRDAALRRLCLTGTPMPHSPLDIYAQFRYLDPGVFGTSFTQFKARYAIMGGFRNGQGMPVQVIGFQNQDEMANKMARLTFQARTEEVLDLPEATHSQKRFSLCDEERRVYRELEKDFIAQVKAGEIVASNALTKLLRLSQITGGFSRTPEGKSVKIGGSKKDLLCELLTDIGSGEPVIVFCRFHEDLDAVRDVCDNLGRDFRELSGRQNQLGGAVWEDGNGDTLAVQLQSGGVGIDLTRARFCVYYSVDFSLGNYEQSLARVHRPGQSRPVIYLHLIANQTIDEKVYASLEEKKDIVASILSQVT